MKFSDYILPAFSFFIWGFWGIAIAVLGVAGVTLNLYITFFGLLALLLYSLYKGTLSKILEAKAFMPLLLLLALFESINTATYFTAFNFTSIANIVFVHLLAPIFVVLASPILLRERVKPAAYAAIILSFIGLALLLSGSGFSLSGNDLIGISLSFISAIGYAASLLARKKLLNLSIAPETILVYQTFFLTLIMLPANFLLGTFALSAFQLGGLVLAGMLMIALPLITLMRGLQRLSSYEVAIIGYLEPLVAVFAGFIFLSQAPSLATLGGGALILGANYLALKRG